MLSNSTRYENGTEKNCLPIITGSFTSVNVLLSRISRFSSHNSLKRFTALSQVVALLNGALQFGQVLYIVNCTRPQPVGQYPEIGENLAFGLIVYELGLIWLVEGPLSLCN